MQPTEIIYCANNLEILKQMPDQSVDLIYMDPPFFTAGTDIFGGNKDITLKKYLKFLEERITELHRILVSNGSFYCHCDWKTEAYIQVLIDKIFSEENLISKIIWKRNFIPRFSFRYIPGSYEVILFYGKSNDIKFNRQYEAREINNETIGKYPYTDPETGKRYRLVDITRSNKSGKGLSFEFLGVTRSWRWKKEKMDEEYKQGRIVQTRPDAVPMLKEYLSEGIPIDDIWSDRNLIGFNKSGRTGYPSERPINLLQRIIQMSSNEGDIILDPFCGSGTTIVAAQEIGRKWIGIDSSPTACRITLDRLKKNFNFVEGVDIKVSNQIGGQKEIIGLSSPNFENWVITTLIEIGYENSDFVKKIKSDKFRETKFIDFNFSTTFENKELAVDYNNELNRIAIPVEIKKKEKVGVEDISRFVTFIKRYGQEIGIFIALSFSKQGITEIQNILIQESIKIIPLSLEELINLKSKNG